MRKEQTAEVNKLIRKMKRIYSIIVSGFLAGYYDKSMKYIEQEEELLKLFEGDVPEAIKAIHIEWLGYRANISAYRGNLLLSFKAANELLRVGQFYNNKRGILEGNFYLGNYYWLSGDRDKAFEHLDRAIKLGEEILNDFMDFIRLTTYHYIAIRVSIDNEDLERAKKYLKRLEEINRIKPEEFYIESMYRLAKGYILKSNMRSRERVMAEDLFRGIMEDDLSINMTKIQALIGLCELLLIELRISNDINIINEIKPLLEKLMGMAQHSGLYFFLIDAYILQGKLALIMFDMESSRHYLMQAQQLSEKYGFIGLAKEISALHKAMMEKKDTWEQMEKRDAPVSERMDLARLDEHLNGKFRRLMMRMERATETPPKKEVF